MRTVTSSSAIVSGSSGSRCRSAIAAASTSSIAREPLSRVASGVSSAVTRQAGHEVAGRHEHDVGLAQRRQDAADVVQERRVRPDHEHAVARHPLALRVEQVRDAVQRHDGLAGARAALDDEHTGVVEPDDLVLLGLDRRDDVAHALAARRVHGREQDRVGVPVGAVGAAGAGMAEHLVGEVDDAAPARVELAAPAHVLGMRAGGDVEGARGRGAPVEQHRFVVLVAQTDPADVGALAGVRVEPPEAQPVVRDVQPLHLRGRGAHRDVALHGRLAGALQRRVVLALHPRAFRVEPGVEPGHVVALGPQFLVVLQRGHRPPHSAATTAPIPFW